MSITCPQCDQAFSTLGDTPKFCSNCGAPLSPLISEQLSVKDASSNAASQDPVADITAEFATPPTAQEVPTPKEVPAPKLVDPLSLSGVFRPHDPGVPIPKDLEETMAPTAGGASTQPSGDEHSARVGDDIGPFRLGRILGSGGMGTVFEATDRDCGQQVALKLLSRQLRGTQETVQRFQRESQIAASINHPRSTFVYHAGQHDNQTYIAMELMDGGTLKDVVQAEGALPVQRAVDFILDIIAGLKVAHAAGVVHRDLKPSNCFIDIGGRAKVGDFGLSKSFISDSSLTQTGTFMGTPQYAAPEQLRAMEVDARADIYALGGTLFYLLSGRAPFVGNAAQVIASIASEKAPNLKTIVPEVPKKLAALISLTLEKDPAKRPQNLEEIRLALRTFSSRGAVPADVGVRLGAYFFDTVGATISASFAGFMATFFLLGLMGAFGTMSPMTQAIGILAQGLAFIAYYLIQEWCLGTTLGKWMFGLRVINDQGEQPKFWQALVRSSILPGIQQFVNYLPMLMMPMQGGETPVDGALITLFVVSTIVGFLSWIPNIICLLTAREKNGYRGFHELASQTRVVQLSGSLESSRPAQVAGTAPLAFDDELSVGNYKITGTLAKTDSTKESGISRVLVGKDLTLDRDVWVYETNRLAGTSEEKAVAIRPTRQRTIHERQADLVHYRVTEAIDGMPLIDYIRTSPSTQWSSFRPVLREITYEFMKAQEEDSLPPDLDPASIWIDQSGRAKILPHLASRPDVKSPGVQSPHQVIVSLMDEIIENHPVPFHAVKFRNGLDTEHETPSLGVIAKTLGNFSNKPSNWTWIDKFGLVAIFLAVEVSTFLSLMIAWAFIGVTSFQLTPAQVTIGFTGCMLLLVVVSSYLTSGGISAKIGNVAICRNSDLKLASRLRCTIRAFVAWMPCLFVMVSFTYLLSGIILMEAHQADSDVHVVVTENELIAPGIVFMLSMAASALLFLLSVFLPSRGPADLVAGTRLARK